MEEHQSLQIVVYLFQILGPAGATLLIKNWLDRGTQNSNETKKSVSETKEAISALNEKMNRIELKLAASGIDDLKANIEILKENRTEHDMKIEALWRAIENFRPKRVSD